MGCTKSIGKILGFLEMQEQEVTCLGAFRGEKNMFVQSTTPY